MRPHVLLALLPGLLLAYPAAAQESSAPPDDPHALAHEKGGVGHQLTVRKVDSAIEVMGKGTVQIWGARKVYDCKSGTLVADFRCEPCEIPLSTYAPQPPGLWMTTLMWKPGNDRDKDAQLSLARHFAKYFDLYPAGGFDRGETELQVWNFKGPRNQGPQNVYKLVMAVGTQLGATTHQLAPGAQELSIAANALNQAGGELDVPVSFSSGCAVVTPTGPRTAKVRLMTGRERCEVSAVSPSAPGVKAGLVVSRSVKLEILYENQPADTLELPKNAGPVELVARATVSSTTPSTDFQPELQWLVAPGAGELRILTPTKVRFVMAPGAAKGEVVLRDAKSGAEDKVVFTQAK